MKFAKYLTMLVLTPATSLGCDGPEPGSYADRFKQAESVAIVRVVSLAESAKEPGHVEGRAEVVEVLKGTFSKVIPVYAYMPSVDCFSPVDVGREYVVFLPNPAGRNDVWFTMFSKTARVTDVPEKLLSTWRPRS